MPTYLNRCEECKHEFEQAQSIHAPALVDCPSCTLPMLRRVIRPGRVAVRVKNGGEGYQPGLARFPGDPRAYCDGPRAVSKLTDWHKRRGREPVDADDIGRDGDVLGNDTQNYDQDDDNSLSFGDFLAQEGG